MDDERRPRFTLVELLPLMAAMVVIAVNAPSVLPVQWLCIVIILITIVVSKLLT